MHTNAEMVVNACVSRCTRKRLAGLWPSLEVADTLRKAKINDIDNVVVWRGTQNKILWFDISMYNMLRVKVLHTSDLPRRVS